MLTTDDLNAGTDILRRLGQARVELLRVFADLGPYMDLLLAHADSYAVRGRLVEYDRLENLYRGAIAPYMTEDGDVGDVVRYDEITAEFNEDFTRLLHDLVHDLRHPGVPT